MAALEEQVAQKAAELSKRERDLTGVEEQRLGRRLEGQGGACS